MGYGTWTTNSFASYSTARGRTFNHYTGAVTDNLSAQEMFSSRDLDKVLNPKNVIRECRDSDEHPNSKPVILGLDVTGSMGNGAVKVAKSLNNIMENLYESIDDVQFMIMGIGDLYCDYAPIQASQFESDIRIAEQLDKVYFEGGGGGNGFESYTAAWYFGLNNCDLDCWKRGKKGTIITTGDEPLNPYLGEYLRNVLGDINKEIPTDTKELYELAKQKFNIYHIAIDDYTTCYNMYRNKVDSSWGELLGDHYKVATLDNLPSVIADIIKESNSEDSVVDSFIVEDYNDTVDAEDMFADGIEW